MFVVRSLLSKKYGGEVLNSIGERLKYLRTKKGITQKELSIATGIPRANLSNYENDTYKPAAAVLNILSGFFEVPKDWILNEDNNSKVQSQVHNEKLNELKGLKHLDGSKVDSRDKHKILDLIDGTVGDLMFNQADVYSEFTEEDMEKIKQSLVDAFLTIKDSRRKERLNKAKHERDQLNEEIKKLENEIQEGNDKDEK